VPFTEFRALHYKQKTILDRQRKSPLTEQILKPDLRIDTHIVGINAIITANLHHYDPARVQAAKTLEARMKALGQIGRKKYEDESSAVQVLVADLQGIFKAESAFLELTGWVNTLSADEAEFTLLLARRNAEKIALPHDSMSEVRKALEKFYLGMAAVIDSDAVINGEAKCDHFISLLNNEIDTYNEHSHHVVRRDIRHVTAA
jgi:hypothetical protein